MNTIQQRPDYTFKYNTKLGRHGWLRLTPAYSVKLVREIISHLPEHAFILDPFSGTATTGLVAAEHGISAHCFDINPFLIWLGNAKCRIYHKSELKTVEDGVHTVLANYKKILHEENWLPNIHNITRWWRRYTLKVLSALRQTLVDEFGEPDNNVSALAWISFCRLIIETSSAAFNHVSMSFHEEAAAFEADQIESLYLEIFNRIVQSAEDIFTGSASIHFVDSRNIVAVDKVKYTHVVTSPPYPNRISYIRELRPYMYWTKFLDTAREAGELDWKAIGGTWGVATSRLQTWKSNAAESPDSLLPVISRIIEAEGKNSLLMANYVWKYFHDMQLHLQSLRRHLSKGSVLCYIVGNSSFYGVQVHAEKLLEESMNSLGFTNIGSKVVRKRNSKKELFEYCVYATWQEERQYEPGFFGENTAQQVQLTLF
ncbi:MAG: DNA adenine methylase [Candidatus Electrothrix scaldis]|nr:MAG: DNA adenine methylase [Candidatus Electrothrix sp. GW3-3]